nr:unnamed protein product [Callosobruchus analis]
MEDADPLETIETIEEIETREETDSADDIGDVQSTEETGAPDLIIYKAVRQLQNPGGVGLRGQPVYIGKRKDRSRIICKKCGRAYYHRSSLSRHLRHECGTMTSYKCPLCGVKVKHLHTFQKHLHFKHPGQRVEPEEIKRI